MEDNVKHILEQADVTGGLHYKNPPVPYACPLPVSLTVGSQIYIQGLVPEVSVRPEVEEVLSFSVNLQRGTGEADPVQLHINPRFEPEGPVVVRNSREGKSWGREEREGTSPFAKGRPFLLVITATTPGYELAVNGLPFATFDYRQGLALADITHLCIHGDVILRSVHIPVPEMPKCVRCPLPEPAKIGDVFTLRGQISPWAEKFVVNLATGPGTEDDLALHLNPRFGEGALIRNCRRGGKWGDEEREGDFPLAPGRAFELRVDALEDAFRVTVDGNTLCDFGHRMPLKKVKYLVAEGDLVVDDVRVESDDVEKLREQADNWSLYMPPEPPQQVLQVGDVVPELMSEAMTYYEPKLQLDSPIHCQEDKFRVLVNGTFLADFPHRIDCSRIDYVCVDGSVILDRIVFA